MIKLILVCAVAAAGAIFFSDEIADVFYKSAETLNSTEFAQMKKAVDILNVSSVNMTGVGEKIDRISQSASDAASDLQDKVGTVVANIES